MWVESRRGGTRGLVAVADGRARGTVGELADALGLPPGQQLRVDDEVVPAETPLSSSPVVHGSVIDHGDVGPSSPAAATIELAVVAGPDAGQALSLDDRSAVVIGRDTSADLRLDNPTVSSRHAVIRRVGERITVEDVGSRNGTWLRGEHDADDVAIDGLVELTVPACLRLGSIDVAVRVPDQMDRPMGVDPVHADESGRVLVNRPPRPPVPENAPPIVVPDGQPDRPNPFFSPLALIAPIVFGVVMVLVLGSWRYALFAVLSPLMLLSGWLTNRRRVSLQRRADAETFTEGLARFEAELGAAATAERHRRAAIAPDPGEVLRRATLPSVRLWERRVAHEDALQVRVGRGRAAWRPAVAQPVGRPVAPAEPCAVMLAAHDGLEDAPLVADLGSGPAGIIGDAELGDALVRSLLLQLCTHHGPADLSIVIVADETRTASWEWARWLPHLRGSNDALRILPPSAASEFAAVLDAQITEHSAHRWLFVVDDVAIVHERASAIRQLIASSDRGALGIVLAETAAQLPASVVTVVDLLTADGRMELRRTGAGSAVEPGVVDGLSPATAESAARRLARWEDPEVPVHGGGLPMTVEATEQLAFTTDPRRIAERWAAASPATSLAAVLGEGIDGPFAVDLVADGPHALVAGTTGAGKSELLRTWLLGLASAHGPSDVVFVLVDYKGGAAFDALRDLPHTVGLVTDLDAHLAERALRSLEAELRHRERLLADAGCSDFAAYRRAEEPGGSLPRLVVVIDEFATLRAELPDFVDALVGIAQRGRSLGVHLVLATQRPAGAVDANIRANTNLRIALRVQTDADSLDVIDDRVAVEIPRSLPGRAWVRRGTDDLAPLQTALVSVPPLDERSAGVAVAPVPIGGGAAPQLPPRVRSTGATTLAATVVALRSAASGQAIPRRPWLPDLPATLGPAALDALAAVSPDVIPLAVGDDPDRQRRTALGWAPATGSVVVLGAVGSGVSTTLVSVGARLQHGVGGRDAWVFAADHGDGSLQPLADRPHVSCVLDASDEAGHSRLLDLLEDEVAERVRTGGAGPIIVVLVDGMGGFLDRLDAAAGGQNAERLARIVRDGPGLGVVFAAGASRPADLPKAMLAGVRARIILSLADPLDLGVLGVRRRTLPAPRPGRALFGADEMVAQIVDQRELPGPTPASVPPSVAPLERSIPLDTLGAAAVGEDGLVVPVGVDSRSRQVAQLRLRRGEHALIAGPPGSGRTTALRSIAVALRAADPDLVMVAVVGAGSPLIDDGPAGPFDAGGDLADVAAVLDRAADDPARRWVVFIDDAERCGDESELLHRILRVAGSVHAIAAVRTNASRSDWPRWLRSVRSSGVGVLLQADPVMDGELLSVRLPRGERTDIPGRGWLVHAGSASLVQLAHP